MRKLIFLLMPLLFVTTAVDAQTDESYQKFRREILSSYGEYRTQILQDYSKFLDTAWKDYETFKGHSLYPQPKPAVSPKAPVKDDTPASLIPQPHQPQAVPKPQTPVILEPEAVNPLTKMISFPFFNMTVKAPQLDHHRLEAVSDHAISSLWKDYQKANIYHLVSPSLQQIRLAFQLNDWLTYTLVRKYCDALYPNDVNSSMVLSHYILVNMGYNVRLACNSKGQVLHLVPVIQKVYGHPFLDIHGCRYYVFSGETARREYHSIGSVSTCTLPLNADLGRSFDLILSDIRFPEQLNKSFHITDGNISLSGEVPLASIMMAQEYVETDVPVYAASKLSSKFEKEILRQAAPQIQGLGEQEAANKLLHFVQYAFKYQTDGDQFGYEKPFFVEENFYYPANDCEDRAVLFAFLVRHLLHLDVHLLYYPSHEATAVRFSDQTIKGDGYIYQDGSKYLVCDPTYIGAKIGQCMPQFEGVRPKVELW